MQESLDLFVLSSEAPHHHAMSDANAIPDAAALPATHISASDAFREISSESTDEQLMLALRDGSEPAFTLLFARYKQPIFGFFTRRLSDSSRAEELTQETFVAPLPRRQALRTARPVPHLPLRHRFPHPAHRPPQIAIPRRISRRAKSRRSRRRKEPDRRPSLDPPRPPQTRSHRPRNRNAPRIPATQLRRNRHSVRNSAEHRPLPPIPRPRSPPQPLSSAKHAADTTNL